MKPFTPLQTLFSNHLHTDIDQNFVDALEAILFLSPPKTQEFEHLFTVEQRISSTDSSKKLFNQHKNNPWTAQTQPWSDEDEYDTDANYKLADLLSKVSKTTEQPKTVSHAYGLADFIIYKLLENTRRLYSANKKTAPVSNNKFNYFNTGSSSRSSGSGVPQLLEQTKLIYQVLDMTREHLSFSDTKKYYARAILGQDVNCSAIDIWGYLCFHEQIPEQYKKIHEDIFRTHLADHMVGKEFLSHFKNLLYKPESKELVKFILSHAKDNDVLEMMLNEKGNPKYGWLLLSMEHLMEKNTKFTLSQKEKILSIMVRSDLLDNKFFSQFVNTIEFEYCLNTVFSGEDVEKQMPSWFSKHVPLEQVGVKRSATFVFDKVSHLSSEAIFYQALVSDMVKPDQKQMIFSKYEHSTEQMKNLVNHMHKHSSADRVKKHLIDFLSIEDNIRNKELLAHIISLNSSYMEVCKSIYQNIRLQEKLTVRDNATPMHKKKI